MKINKIYFFGGLLLVLLSWGCTDFLKEENPSEVTTDFLYHTKDGLESAVVGLYNIDRAMADDDESKDFSVIMGDCGTDIDFMRAALNQAVSRYRPDLNFASQTTVRNWWKKEYMIIERANSIITFGSATDIPDKDKKKILREAYIHRANSYFWLVRKFDNIWLNLEPTTAGNFENREFKVASQEDVYKVIISDLDSAISYFDGDWTVRAGQYGLGTALFLRTDVALWRQDYQTAATLAEKLITEGPYKLADPSAIFTRDGRDNTSESIFVMQFDEFATGGADVGTTGPSGHRLPLVFTPYYSLIPGMVMASDFGGYGWGRVHPNEYLLNLYNPSTDKRWDSWWQHYYIFNNKAFDFSSVTYQLGDTAKYGEGSQLTGTNFFKNAEVGCKKYFDWVKLPNATRSFNNLYIYRFSEVYLMAAEANWRLGNETKALHFINELRKSRISAADPNRELTSFDLETLVEEQARELAFEGRRWFFLKRIGELVDRVREHGGLTMFKGIIATDPAWYSARTNIKEFHVRWPIPQEEIDAMKGFPQNEGY
ncbi:MAG: RagB/SusD family nutrient uptake outer membrane protein [Bacteroidetes bacterium]|nr:RagB/SusD family nutrient uptake outer membrane protein [Bacteroidota bacterium]